MFYFWELLSDNFPHQSNRIEILPVILSNNDINSHKPQ